ncbi:Hypothetical predicted protein [Lecanosticta acicola]|uniref:Uncharacterized protein n=1 Tax=Lecanosticta acicola TaxID=111012 RepID=A0AAI9E7W2_9PEZI|nr:Hypothetical predicted protein [Lecanosticta acicola]
MATTSPPPATIKFHNPHASPEHPSSSAWHPELPLNILAVLLAVPLLLLIKNLTARALESLLLKHFPAASFEWVCAKPWRGEREREWKLIRWQRNFCLAAGAAGLLMRWPGWFVLRWHFWQCVVLVAGLCIGVQGGVVGGLVAMHGFISVADALGRVTGWVSVRGTWIPPPTPMARHASSSSPTKAQAEEAPPTPTSGRKSCAETWWEKVPGAGFLSPRALHGGDAEDVCLQEYQQPVEQDYHHTDANTEALAMPEDTPATSTFQFSPTLGGDALNNSSWLRIRNFGKSSIFSNSTSSSASRDSFGRSKIGRHGLLEMEDTPGLSGGSSRRAKRRLL